MDFAQKARGVLNWDSWVLFPEVGTCSQAWEVRKPGVSSGAAPLWWAPFLPPPTAPSGPVLISFLHLPRQQMRSVVLVNESAQRQRQPLLPDMGWPHPLVILLRHHCGGPVSADWRGLCSLFWICSEQVIYSFPPHSTIQATPLLWNVSVVTFLLSVADSFIQNLRNHVILSKQAGRGIRIPPVPEEEADPRLSKCYLYV